MYRVRRAPSDLHAAAYALGIVVALVFGVRFLREAGKIPNHLARKILHISEPLFGVFSRGEQEGRWN